MTFYSNFLKIIFSLVLWVNGSIHFVNAQNTPLNFQHFSIDDGLSQNSVFDIFQDKTGFTWIGTGDGLNRYDGYEFKIFMNDSKDSLSISHNHITKIIENTDGQLLIGTGNGVNIFDHNGETFQHIDADDGDSFVNALIEDTKNYLWVGKINGLEKFEKKNDQYQAVRDDFLTAVNQQSSRIYAIFEDDEERIWVSELNGLILYDTRLKKQVNLPLSIQKNVALKSGIVRDICKDGNGDLWFGTEKAGLFHYRIKQDSLTHYTYQGDSNSLADNIVRTVFFKHPHEIWAGTRNGLSILSLETNVFSNFVYNKYEKKGLSNSSVRRIYEDKAGSLWIGTYNGGLNLLYPSANNFQLIEERFGDKDGLSAKIVSSVLKDDSDLWVGTEGGGLNIMEISTGTFHYYTKENTGGTIPNNIIKSVQKDGERGVWISSLDGLTYFDKHTKKFNLFRFHPQKEHPSNRIHQVVPVENGVWVGTDGSGLIFMDRAGNSELINTNTDKYSGNLAASNINAMIKDPAGNLWIGSPNGLNFLDLDKKHVTLFEKKEYDPHSLSHNSVLSLYIDERERLWIGTNGGGINVYDPESGYFSHITMDDGLPGNQVNAISKDRVGRIWVSTNKGLSMLSFPGNQLPATSYWKPQITNFSADDGLLNNQFMTGSVESDSDGNLYFGGLNGLNVFSPEKLVSNTYVSKVVFTEFLFQNELINHRNENNILDKAISRTKQITLESHQSNFTIKFAALNFINPDKNQYAYNIRKPGSKDQWIELGNQRIINFSDLQPGRHELMVKASNNDAFWSDEPTTLMITVLPPLHKTWWAFLLYGMVISSLIFLFYQYAKRNSKLQNELLIEHLIREKENELHQNKLRFFTNICHEIKTPLTLIMAPIENLITQNRENNRVQNQLMMVKRNGSHLVRLIGQLLDFRKLETGNIQLEASKGDIVAYVNEIFLSFKGYSLHKNIQFEFLCEEKQLELWFDGDKIEKILYNLLSNAFKFTPNYGRITIKIHTQANRLEAPLGVSQDVVVIAVEDNGLGIPAADLSKIFERFQQAGNSNNPMEGVGIGLAYCKELVKLHHGSIDVVSIPKTDNSEGLTRFSIKIPMGDSYLNELEIKQTNGIDAPVVISENPHFNEMDFEKTKSVTKASMQEENPVMLIIEDNPELRNLLNDFFSNDFETVMAENGLQGLERALDLQPDIVLSDVMMPEMDGIELCTNLKKDEKTSHIPIILLTSRTPIIFKIEGLDSGADDYITKPFNLKMLEVRVWNLLESRAKLRERFQRAVTLMPKNIALSSPDEAFLEKVMNFIEENMDEPFLNVENMGREVGMSRVHLYRKIKALTNESVVAFIRNVRLKRAAQLLSQDKLTVSEVVYMVGFQDHNYFRKCFKQKYGLNPSEYSTGKVIIPD